MIIIVHQMYKLPGNYKIYFKGSRKSLINLYSGDLFQTPGDLLVDQLE